MVRAREDTALLRGYLVAGDSARISELVDDNLGSMDWGFMVEPLAEDLLRQIPKRHLQNVFDSCLAYVIRNAAPPEPRDRGVPSHEPHIVRTRAGHRLHPRTAGPLRCRRGGIRGAAYERSTKQAGRRRPSRDASLYRPAQGRRSAARLRINEAVAAEKHGTRRRHVFPPFRAFALALLALVRIDSPAARQELDQCCVPLTAWNCAKTRSAS